LGCESCKSKEMGVRRTRPMITAVLLTTVLFAVMTTSVAAEADIETAPVSGKVIDSDGYGLVGMTVALENGSSVVTNALGDYVIMCTPGEHTLTFSGSGINTLEMMINVGDSGLAMGTVTTYESNEGTNLMMTAAIILAGVIVTALVVFTLLRKKRKK